MLTSEKLAIAAHLHVLLRRKTGRVTDTEWMAGNAQYAAEIVRFARAKAVEEAAPELAEWADKLERAVLTLPAVPVPAVQVPMVRAPTQLPPDELDTRPQNAAPTAPSAPAGPRYIGGIR